MGRKNVLICLMLLLLFIPLFAEPNMYFKLNDRCNLIDLEPTLSLGTNKYLTHTMSSSYKDQSENTDPSGIYDDSYYYYKQALATVGIVDLNFLNRQAGFENAKLKVTVTSGENWYYTLVEDSSFKRHFGVDLFARASTGSGGDFNVTGVNGNQTDTGVRFGKQNGIDAGLDSVELVVANSDGTSKYKSAWFDICLVTDLPVFGDDQLIPTDSYYFGNLTFEISLISATPGPGGEDVVLSYQGRTLSAEYLVQVVGYYKPGDPSSSMDSTAIFYVERNEDAIDIANTYDTGTKVEIAQYHFTTNSKNATSYSSSDPGKVYIFLSSSSDARYANNTEFSLDWIDGPREQQHTNTSIKYLTTLESSNTTFGHKYGDPQSAETLPSNGAVSYNPANFYDYSLVLEPEKYKDKSASYIRWHDDGAIYLSIPKVDGYPDAQSLGLKAGSYQSNIYIHIVTDFHPK